MRISTHKFRKQSLVHYSILHSHGCLSKAFTFCLALHSTVCLWLRSYYPSRTKAIRNSDSSWGMLTPQALLPRTSSSLSGGASMGGALSTADRLPNTDQHPFGLQIGPGPGNFCYTASPHQACWVLIAFKSFWKLPLCLLVVGLLPADEQVIFPIVSVTSCLLPFLLRPFCPGSSGASHPGPPKS